MTKTVHPRRALAILEVKAWEEANLVAGGLRAADGSCLPGEIQGVKIRGTARPASADGRVEGLSWRHIKATPERSIRVKRLRDGSVRRTVSPRSSREPAFRPRPSDGTSRLVWRGHEGPTPEQLERETRPQAWGARRQACAELSQYGQLQATTVTFGQSVPKHLRTLTQARSRQTRVVRTSALDKVTEDFDGNSSELSFLDTLVDERPVQELAAAELLEWLRVEAGLTGKELKALQQRAAGLAIKDRHCLARARHRARAALL